MVIEERLKLFQEMVLCCHNLYIWIYDEKFNLLQTNCPDMELVQTLFSLGDERDRLLLYSQDHLKPVIISVSFGLRWVAIPQLSENYNPRIYMFGPFFTSDYSSKDLEKAIEKNPHTPAFIEQINMFLRSLPVVSQSRMFEYSIMLYYCITNERISVSDLHYLESERISASNLHHPESERISRKLSSGINMSPDVHGTYAMEQEMLRMVREGNLDYQKQIDRLAVSGNLGKLSDSPERQLKNAVLVCTILFSRAAIEGGLSPEIAMTLTDHYFQSVEDCNSSQELQEISKTMQKDFVTRVHRSKAGQLSNAVQEVCDYINLHIEENPTIKQISQQLKYSEYYLSHKFHQQTGMTIGSYIMQQKLDKAVDLLRVNALTVKEISERLHFCSQSYFAEQFKAVYGVTPTQWREKH